MCISLLEVEIHYWKSSYLHEDTHTVHYFEMNGLAKCLVQIPTTQVNRDTEVLACNVFFYLRTS